MHLDSPTQDPQLETLIQQQVQHILQDLDLDPDPNPQPSPSNVYFDKQLIHLVVSQQFNFVRISALLTEAFKEHKIDTSEEMCRRRWAFIHRHWGDLGKLREREMEKKRERSVAAFSSPYSLYSVDQLIENLEASQKQRRDKNHQPAKVEQPLHQGYNIFKDSFRIPQKDQHYLHLQQKMQEALQKAQQQPYTEKPLYFTPEYKNLQQFQVKQEELTADKMKQIMAYQIQMERVNRELQVRKDEEEELRFQRIAKKRLEMEKEKGKGKSSLSAEIEENWDDYESD